MATEMSEYLADAILTALCHDGSISVPTELTIKIMTTMPARDGTGGVEADYTSYAAQTVACGAASKWETPALNSDHYETSNHEAIEFPENTGSSQTAAGYAIYDDSANLLFLDTEEFEIENGYQPIIAANDLVIGWASDAAAAYDLQAEVFNAIFANTAMSAKTSIDIEQCKTLPSKDDSSTPEVEADYTGYAAVSLACGAVSDWDAIGDEDSYRMVANTAEHDFGVKNTGDDQDLVGFVLRDNGGMLLYIGTYSETISVETNTKMVVKADAIHVRF
jgi:hypothetical protein